MRGFFSHEKKAPRFDGSPFGNPTREVLLPMKKAYQVLIKKSMICGYLKI